MQRSLLLVLFWVTSACGAPTKSASDVAGIFQGTGRTLQAKETDLCSALAGRTSPPTTQGMSIDLGGCQNAGLAALNYSTASSFAFLGLDGSVPATPDAASQVAGTGDDKVIHTSVRSQIWLNKSLLDLAQSVGSLLAKQQASGNNTGVITLPNSASGGFSGLVTPVITVLEAPTLDPTNFSFAMKVNIKLTGLVKADHDILISGQLLNNMFAVTVQTAADRTFAQSILKNFQVVILLIPHAEDIYVDLFVDLNIFDFGAEKLVESQVNSFLSTGLKSILDTAMKLGSP